MQKRRLDERNYYASMELLDDKRLILRTPLGIFLEKSYFREYREEMSHLGRRLMGACTKYVTRKLGIFHSPSLFIRVFYTTLLVTLSQSLPLSVTFLMYGTEAQLLITSGTLRYRDVLRNYQMARQTHQITIT